jgi:hypothetical protein
MKKINKFMGNKQKLRDIYIIAKKAFSDLRKSVKQYRLVKSKHENEYLTIKKLQ